MSNSPNFSSPTNLNTFSSSQFQQQSPPNLSMRGSSYNMPVYANRANIPQRFPQGPVNEQFPQQLLQNFNNPNMNSELTSQLNNLIMTWKVQSNLQAEIYKNQLSQLVEMQKQLSLKLASVQSPPPRLPSPEIVKHSPSLNIKFKQEAEPVLLSQQPMSKKTLKNQIRAIIQFVLANYGRISEEQMNQEKVKYQENPDLLAIFNGLLTKYSSTIKTKEEMIKYILRKAFKFIKKSLKKELQADSKEVSSALCQRYFADYSGNVPDLDNEEDFLKFLLPFRKNSKNKTMNSTFIHEVFSSEAFQRDYLDYLEDLDEILEADNNGKIDRLVSFIEECLKKKKIQDIQKYKRIPWPELWLTNTKKIAIELPSLKIISNLSDPKKKVKQEYSLKSYSPERSFHSESDLEKSTDSSI